MNHISSRLYKDEKDFQIMIDLIASVRPLEHLNPVGELYRGIQNSLVLEGNKRACLISQFEIQS